MRVEGRGALVAGGASGLGEATARALAGAGASVTIADLNAEKGAALAAELGASASFVEADVTDEAGVSAAVERAAAADGGLRISVCCAGIGWAERIAHKGGPHNLEYFSNVVKVNLIGTFNVLRLAAATMSENEPDEEGERGVCVNTASIAAFDGQIGQVAYAASKGGIVGMTLPAARDMASRGVRVVTIAPGLFDTPLLAAPARGGARGARRRHPLPLAPRPARRVRTAGRPDRRQPDAQRRDDPPRRRPADAAEVAGAADSMRCVSVGPFGLGVAPDALAPGRADREAGHAAGGGDPLERDQVDLAAAGEAVEVREEAAGVAGVAAAGDEEPAGLRAPAVLGANADRLGRAP